MQHVLRKFLGSVAGRGIAVNIADCYEFILNHWQPGDRIFIVGFSRGAYTARCVAQVLSLCGVPTPQPGDPSTPFRRFSRSTRLVAERAVHRVYEHGAGHPRGDFEAERDELARRFRVEFGADDGGAPNAHPHFIGAFDTVAALGAKGVKWYALVGLLAALAAVPLLLVAAALHLLAGTPFVATFAILAGLLGLGVWIKSERDAVRFIDDFPTVGSPRRRHRVRWRAENYDRGLSGHVGYARQASAIDEDRADFPRVPWGRNTVVRPRIGDEPPPLVQLWFAGNHSDVGGSYPEAESRLSDVSLAWMVDEATGVPGPMVVDRAKLAVWPDAAGMQHSELEAVRDSKLWWVPAWAPAWLRSGWSPAPRKPSGSPVHPSVHERFAAAAVVSAVGTAPYRPPCLADDPRFRQYYDGGDPDSAVLASALATATFRIAADPPFDASVGAESAAVAELLARERASGATIVVVTDLATSQRDDYRDALSLAHLDQIFARTATRSFPVEVRPAADPLFVAVGRLLLDDATDSDVLARATGVGAVVKVSANGELRVVQLKAV